MTHSPSNVFSRGVEGRLPAARHAEGVWIEDESGRRYLDACGGAVVVNVGHGREEITAAVHDQIQRVYYAHPTMFTIPVVEELATALTAHAPPGIERFYFLSGGGEAVEAAIKMARQIHLAAGRSQKFKLVARWKSYHGLSLGALSAMGRTRFRTPFAPMLSEVVHIPPPYCYRCSFGLDFPACELRCAHFLEETILNVGPEIVSAFLGETQGGATLAAAPPPPGYWPLIREICDRHDVLLIQDEVMCGMGRTGRWFAGQHDDVAPDLVTLGKGLTSGALPLSAVGVQGKHFETLCASPGGFVHGGTFSHHGIGAAASLAVIRILEREGLVERVDEVGNQLGARLRKTLGDHPHVGDVRGRGMLWGVELVQNRDTRAPFPRERQVIERLARRLFERGVLVYKATHLAGAAGDAFVIAPPFIIQEKEIRFLLEQLSEAIAEKLP